MEKVKVYGYRWIVLLLFAIVDAMVEVHWVNFAPITGEAARFYGVTPLQIGFLSMTYMIVYLALCIPASYVIDRFGLRIGVGIGAALMGVFGLVKGIYASDYTAVLISQFGLAVAQPFIINAMTKVGAKWFPVEERATAAGLAVLSQYVGIIVALGVTPVLYAAYAMKGMLMIYGISSVIAAVLFLVLVRDNPPTPPTAVPEEEEGFNFFAGLAGLLKRRDMIMLLVLFFMGLGMFNAVTTWIEQILSPRGINAEQAGFIGASMMVGGIIGAIILPVLSDKLRKRKPFLVITMAGVLPGLAGLTFFTGYGMLLAASFVLGFFIMSAGPIGFQYGAEVGHPTPESTTQGLILLSGQISGVIFIFAMDRLRSPETGSMTPFMIIFLALMLVSVVMAALLRESPLIQSAENK